MKKDWAGEENDHFSANVTVGERRRTAAFLLKGPTNFREMTLAMCGKNADQIYRLTRAGAEVPTAMAAAQASMAARPARRFVSVIPSSPRVAPSTDGARSSYSKSPTS